MPPLGPETSIQPIISFFSSNIQKSMSSPCRKSVGLVRFAAHRYGRSYLSVSTNGMPSALPLFYVIEGLNNVMVYGNIPRALVDMGIVVVITIVIFLAAVRLFKWRED